MQYYQPYVPLYISGDDAGNARRQAEADRINKTTNRWVDCERCVEEFAKLVQETKEKP